MAEIKKIIRPAAPKFTSVAEYLAWQMNACGKSQVEIAKEAGFPKPNVLSMMKKGDTKVPLEKIGKLAKAIEIDPVFLFRMVMSEYYPSTWEEIQKMIGQPVLTDNEVELIETIRKAKVTNPKLRTNEERKALIEVINTLKPGEAA